MHWPAFGRCIFHVCALIWFRDNGPVQAARRLSAITGVCAANASRHCSYPSGVLIVVERYVSRVLVCRRSSTRIRCVNELPEAIPAVQRAEVPVAIRGEVVVQKTSNC